MKPEAFAHFLQLLSPDEEEAARLYITLQKKLVGFFNLKGISDPTNAADETLDRAVEKIEAGASVPDIAAYCFGIARNIARERLRLLQRESSAFSEFVGDQNHSGADQVERLYNLLKPCFEQLDMEEQRLLLAYCHDIQGRARGEHRRQLAAALQITTLALRVRVARLRTNLTDCVRKRSNAA